MSQQRILDIITKDEIEKDLVSLLTLISTIEYSTEREICLQKIKKLKPELTLQSLKNDLRNILSANNPLGRPLDFVPINQPNHHTPHHSR